MKYDIKQHRWICRAHYKGVQHSRSKQLFICSPFFQKTIGINPKQLSKFTAFCLCYLNPWSTIKSDVDKLDISYKLGLRWGSCLRDIFCDVHTKIPVTLGDNDSVLEIDGTYFGKDWKHGKKGTCPKGYRTKMWFRIIERNFTDKLRHRRRTFIVREESDAECIPLMLKHITTDRKVTIFADGCAFGDSKKMRSHSDRFHIDQCSHTDEMWVKHGTEYKDAHDKVHDNTCESSFQYDKLLSKSHFGLDKRNMALSFAWLSESDWRNNYTDMTPIDSLFTLIKQCTMLYQAELPEHML